MPGRHQEAVFGDQSSCSDATSLPAVDYFELPSRAFLAVLIVVVPLMTAWAKEWSIAVLFFASAGLAATGAVRSLLNPSSVRWSYVPLVLALAACLLVALQLVPLPRGVLQFVSPFQVSAFENWPEISSAVGGPSQWSQISLTPHLTTSGLALGTGYLMLIAGLWFYLKSISHVRWLLTLVAFSAVTMATIGMLQVLFGNGKFLWLFDNPMRSVEWPAKGTFTNQNHFAGFLSLGFGACMYQIFGASPPPKSHDRGKSRRSKRKSSSSGFGNPKPTDFDWNPACAFWAGGAMLILLASILSFSRGGIMAMLVAVAVTCAAFRSRLKLISRMMIPAIVFCILGVIAFGGEYLSQKWSSLVTSTSLSDVSAGRAALWDGVLDASGSFLVAGSGAGSHAEVYPIWMKEDFGKRFSHAENGYLQILLEMGVPGVLLLLTILAVVGRTLFRSLKTGSLETRIVVMICVSGFAASLAHSVGDFVWYIPACCLVTLTLLVVLVRTAELDDAAAQPSSGKIRSILPAGSVLVVVGLAAIFGTSQVIADARSERPWLEYRALAIELGKKGDSEIPPVEQLNEMIAHLESCLQIDSQDARAMASLSLLYLRRFEVAQASSDNPMSVAEIKDTADSVGFESRREMLQWMAKAFGNNVSDLLRSLIAARNSLAGQPLRASQYLVLHQLSFLVSSDTQAQELLMDQVLRLRPHDAGSRYAVGIADIDSGRFDEGFSHLSYAFGKDARLRKPILSLLMQSLEVQEMVDVLNPDIGGLMLIFQTLRGEEHLADKNLVAKRFRAKFAEATHHPSHGYWNSAATIFHFLNEHESEVDCLNQALIYRPQTYSTRRLLAFRLAAFGDKALALAALKSCLRRQPDDTAVKSRLEQLVRVSSRSKMGTTN